MDAASTLERIDLQNNRLRGDVSQNVKGAISHAITVRELTCVIHHQWKNGAGGITDASGVYDLKRLIYLKGRYVGRVFRAFTEILTNATFRTTA